MTAVYPLPTALLGLWPTLLLQGGAYRPELAKLNANAVVVGVNLTSSSELLEFGGDCLPVSKFEFDRHWNLGMYSQTYVETAMRTMIPIPMAIHTGPFEPVARVRTAQPSPPKMVLF